MEEDSLLFVLGLILAQEQQSIEDALLSKDLILELTSEDKTVLSLESREETVEKDEDLLPDQDQSPGPDPHPREEDRLRDEGLLQEVLLGEEGQPQDGKEPLRDEDQPPGEEGLLDDPLEVLLVDGEALQEEDDDTKSYVLTEG